MNGYTYVTIYEWRDKDSEDYQYMHDCMRTGEKNTALGYAEEFIDDAHDIESNKELLGIGDELVARDKFGFALTHNANNGFKLIYIK